MNNADLLVRELRAAGVRHGFGIPSGNVLPLMEAMRRGGIDFVLTAHEGSAGFAADVTARLSGRPGLCLATLGPGATNLATGVGGAHLDRSPLVAVTCNVESHLLGRRVQMAIDHHALFAPITKASFPLAAGTVAAGVREALAVALTEPRGPVHLDLPEDVALAPAGPVPEGPPPAAHPLAAPAPAALNEAVRLLGRARRPLAVIGASAMRMRDPGRLTRLVEAHHLPFATTTMAKGLIPDDHPLAVGCIERACRQIQRAFLHEADLIVGVGYDPVEVEYEAWVGTQPLLHADIEPLDAADPGLDLRLELCGDLDATAEALARGAAGVRPRWPQERLAAHRAAFARALRPASAGFCPHEAIDVVRRVLPRGGVLAFDVGAHTHQIASQWPAYEPGTFLITNGWSSMGFGLPAAIAAGLARPERPVVCLLGDGCFQMTCGELAAAKRLGLRLPVVVLDDGWLGLIKVKQERRQLPLHGTALPRETDRAPPAHYFGVPAVGVRDAGALAAALERALGAPGPTVIEALVDPAHYSETVFD